MKSTNKFAVVFVGFLTIGAFFTQSTYAYNLRKQLVQVNNTLQKTLTENSQRPFVTPEISLPPTTVPTTTIVPTILPTPTEALQQETIYVTKTVSVYVTVTPNGTSTGTPTPTPTATLTPLDPPNTGWIINRDGGDDTYEICRFPGAGDTLRIINARYSFSSPNIPIMHYLNLIFSHDTTIEEWPETLSEGQVSPVLTGSCYNFVNPQGWIFSFERYLQETDDIFYFLNFGSANVTSNIPSGDDYHFQDYNYTIPDINLTNWILLDEPG